MDNPQNIIWKAYDEPKTHVYIHTWWTPMNIMMNPNEDHQECKNILMYSQEHNNILKFIMFTQIFQVKASGAQDTWHKSIGHPPTATRAKELYK